MAELIYRSALLESMKRLEKDCEDVMICPSWCSAVNVIKEQPTTTEAEIRAKAIEEFAELLNEKIGKLVVQHKEDFKFASGLSLAWNMVDEVAEQLKR